MMLTLIIFNEKFAIDKIKYKKTFNAQNRRSDINYSNEGNI